MQIHLEKEIKFLVSEEKFIEILDSERLSLLGNPNQVIQNNFYFDTDKFDLCKQNKTLRVRIKKDSYKLTLKCKEDNSQIANSMEYSQNLSAEEMSKIFSRGKWPIKAKEMLESQKISTETLKPIGDLLTSRITFYYKGWEVCMDRNFYLGNIDWEIEIEAKAEINEKTLSEIIEILKLDSNVKHNSFGKYTRFIKSLMK